jgi:DNA end-binding protein Ku
MQERQEARKMAARASWRGGLEFAGFPIHVQLKPRVKSRSGESFKTLAPDGQPVRSVYLDSSGDEVGRDECRKGVPGPKDTWLALSEEAVERIAEGQKSVTLTPHAFSPAAQVPRELAIQAFAVVPDDKVPGSDKPLAIIWNGLLASGDAYCTEITMSGGGRDAILAIYADERGLWAVTLPYVDELHPDPEFEFELDDEAAEKFTALIQAAGQARDFDHSEYESQYRARRASVIEAVVSGADVPAPTTKTPDLMAPDLMAALDASLAAAKTKTKPAAPRRKKVAA